MYVIMMVVGFGFILISLVAGDLLEFEGANMSMLRPSLIAVTLVVAGGIGYLGSPHMPDIVLLPAGLLAGTLTGLLLHTLVIAPMHRAQNTSTVDRQSLIGKVAKVTSNIPQLGFGQIEYEVNGSRVTSPAKGEEGCGVKQGETVVIVYIENNVYFVRPFS